MIKLFKYMKECGATALAIIALLVVQAYCDLALPQYTSDIVDIGIQQSGIENIAPDEMRPQTLENLCLFLSEADAQTVRNAYVLEGERLVLHTSEKAEIEQLNALLGVPMMMISSVESSGKTNMTELRLAADAGAMTKAQLLQMKDEMMTQAGDSGESMITQRALLFVRAEYEALGIDMGAYQTQYLLKTGGKMLAYTFVMMAATIFAGMLGAYTAAKIGKNLRGKLFKKVVSFSSCETDKFSTASLITRNTNDVQQVQMAMVMILRFVFYAPIIGIGGVIKVAGTKTGMSWVIGVAVGLIVLLVGTLVAIAMPKFKKMQVLVDRLNLVSREILTGLSVIRAFSREKYEEERFDGANQDLMKTQLFTNRVMTFMMPVMMLVMNGITVLIVWLGAQGISMGSLQVGDMMAFITYTMQIVMAFLMITMLSVMLPRAGVAAERIEEVLNTPAAIHDPEKPKDNEKNWQGIISFEDVSFRYPGADGDTLEHLTFQANPGETTAIIGSTGCGKSTLIHLIPRFYDVTQGRIMIDGVDIRELSQKKLHSLLGFVPQKGVLFSGDIESNLKFGGEEISDRTMHEAADIAQASSFIGEKTEGFNSPIAQGGTNVSGGQKQRLSIARAIAKKPRIFLFDDSFSALDYKTDVVLRKALNEKLSDTTILIVAQRISTILHANQIIVLEEGKIVGSGTHEKLLNSCEAYREIAKSQLSESELNGGLAS